MNNTCDTSGAGTDYPSGVFEFIPGFVVVFFLLSYSSICVVFCRSLIVFSFGHCVYFDIRLPRTLLVLFKPLSLITLCVS